MTSCLRLTLALILILATAAHAAAPHVWCATWLETADRAHPISKQTAAPRWAAATRRLPPRTLAGPSLISRLRARLRNLVHPPGASVIDERAGDADQIIARLGRVQSDLMSIDPARVVLNHAVFGRAAIRRHLDEVDRREAVRAANVTDQKNTFRPAHFAGDAWRGTVYAGLAGLFYVLGAEQAMMDRLASVVLSVATAAVFQARAQTFVLNAYFNLKNGIWGGGSEPRGRDELATAQAEFTTRLRAALDADEPALVYQGFDVPIPLSVVAAGRPKARRVPTAAELRAAAGRWPADPRRLIFDQILYVDEDRGEPVLLTFAREHVYPQDPTFHR